MLTDRFTTNIAKSQIGFYNFVIKPTFEAASIILNNSIEENLRNLE